MSDYAQMTIVGNVGCDPERKKFESGKIITKFTVGVGRYDSKDKCDCTDWFKVETFSALGEYVKKGKKILCSGRPMTSVYTNKENVKVKDHILLAHEIQLLTPKDKTEETKSQPSEQPKEVKQPTQGEIDYEKEMNKKQEPSSSEEYGDMVGDDEIPFS